MKFEDYLDQTSKSENLKPTYLSSIEKFYSFLNNNEFYPDGGEKEKVELILSEQINWKYDIKTKRIYDYKKYLQKEYPYLLKRNIEELSINELKILKEKILVKGDQLLYAINMAYGPRGLSAAIQKIIDWKNNGLTNLKILQLEFWDELRKIYLDYKILKRHENGVDIKFEEDHYHIYIVHSDSKKLITIKLYIKDEKNLFEFYKEKRITIEKQIGGILEWNFGKGKPSTICKTFNFDIHNKQIWPEMLKTLSNEIRKFIEIFKKNKKEINVEKNSKKGEKMEYQRIVYGAPGTGKSYMLKKESEETFKDIIIEQTIIDSDANDNTIDRQYWLVGAFWGAENKLDEFIKNGYWQNGWEDKFLNKVKEIKSGDYIGIKTLNRHTNETVVRALGIVIKNYNDGSKIDVNWLIKEEKAYSNRRYSATIHKITGTRIDMFAPLVDLEKNNGKQIKIIEEIINPIERVTFYDGYTYGQFVGTYKPVPSENNSENIIYKYVPGPLMTTLVKALQNLDHNFLLIIEEINRAKADRVFGNIFQLLDRNETGQSQYPITISTEVEKYLKEQFEDESQYQEYFGKGLSLPSNLYIWSTMNNADQGVYPLDTAFKRRWNFEYIGLNDNVDKFGDETIEYLIDLEFYADEKNIKRIPKSASWNDFREKLNIFLLENGINEDRLIAPFFINPLQFTQDAGENEDSYWIDESPYLNKLLMYIFDDVLKHKISVRRKLFTEDILSFSQLVKKYKTGKCIYSDEFLASLDIQEWE
ncbi:MAG: DUF4268 domain-containing protein [Cetobacterium sp.]|uniref:DUF4268 domain-containing protein n=1 Tax=Cetobacterium sp. TaxID=2071632 RepID=UPI003F395135